MSAPLARAAVALAAFAAALAFAQAPPAGTLPAEEWRAIRSIVLAQREALVAGDAARAFSHASDGIRVQFGDAETFMDMVDRSYRALVEARSADALEGAVIDGLVIQPLRLVMPDDTVLVALYTMERQRGGAWKIAGCVIAPSTLRAV
ncbi:hypothetical protein BURK1_00916 [Burkholderiales bacterium]|nr:hypothetical protein BURK1_00916 [Burkholderiales bacterium]